MSNDLAFKMFDYFIDKVSDEELGIMFRIVSKHQIGIDLENEIKQFDDDENKLFVILNHIIDMNYE